MNEIKPPDRLPNEPDRWFGRFERYYLPLGSERTMEATWRNWKQKEAQSSKGRRPARVWYEMAEKWSWAKRASQYDAAISAIAEAARIISLKDEAAKWARRREEIKETDYGKGGKLRQVVEDFLTELPRFKKTKRKLVTQDGQTVEVITIAMNVTLAQLAQAEKIASDLQRVAADMHMGTMAQGTETFEQRIRRLRAGVDGDATPSA